MSYQPTHLAVSSEIVSDSNSGWACVVFENSAEFFGTGRAVKVRGTVDGVRYEATLLPVGDGQHMMPIRATTRKQIGKGLGDKIEIEINEFLI